MGALAVLVQFFLIEWHGLLLFSHQVDIDPFVFCRGDTFYLKDFTVDVKPVVIDRHPFNVNVAWPRRDLVNQTRTRRVSQWRDQDWQGKSPPL